MNLTEHLEELGVCLYQRNPSEDYILAGLWDELTISGAISQLVARNAYNLSGFLSLLQPPNVAVYTTEGGVIEGLHWAEPVATSAEAVYFSSWWHWTTRGTKRHAIVMAAIYELLFSLGKKTIIGVTKQGMLLALHRKIGYTVLDPIPHLFDDEPAWIMHLTEPSFKQGTLYRTAQRALNGRERLNAAA